MTSNTGDSRSGLDASFQYCPRCGQAAPVIRDERSLLCGHCGFLFFFNSAAAAGAFIFHDQHLLLCIRAREPGKGLLDVPGGFIEFGETVEEGLRREIHEELNIEVADLRYFMSFPNDYRYAGVPYRTCDLFFECQAESLTGLRAADDVGEVVLRKPESVDESEFAFTSTRRAFRFLSLRTDTAPRSE